MGGAGYSTEQKPHPLLRLREASSIIGVCINTLRGWDKAGKVEAVRMGNQRRIPLREVLRLAEEYGKGGDLYLTFHVRDYATSELLKALAFRLEGVTYLNESDMAGLIVSALAHAQGSEEGSSQCKRTTTM